MLTLIGLIIFTVAMVVLGEKTGLPWPALLTVLTMVITFFPTEFSLEIPSEFILPIFLPPLLWALARKTSWGVIRAQWVVVLSLSVLLVVVTIATVGMTAAFMMSGIGFFGAMLIGAAVAPPDPVAVEAVAEPAGIPPRILSALQTEGLFNDAASIVAFHLALAGLVQGQGFTTSDAISGFLYSAVVAGVIGFVIAVATSFSVDRISDLTARNVLLWVVPFATYLVAEEVGASGVIAVVVAAIELNSRQTIEAETRLSGQAFWSTIDMLFTGIAFGLIGLSANQAVREVGAELWHSVLVGVVLSIVAIVVRLVWMYCFYLLNRRSGQQSRAPMSRKEVLVMSWSGMRGLVTLALVLSVPWSFPYKSELTAIALTVLICTMVIPGLLLPALIRWLGLRTSAMAYSDEMRKEVSRVALDAALGVVKNHVEELDAETEHGLRRWITSRLDPVGMTDPEVVKKTRARLAEGRKEIYQVRAEAVAAAQEALLKVREAPDMNPGVVDEVLREVDHFALIASKGVKD